MTTIELAAEEITEQAVVAVPFAAIVKGDDERVRARALERIDCIDGAEHRIAQGWVIWSRIDVPSRKRLRFSGWRV